MKIGICRRTRRQPVLTTSGILVVVLVIAGLCVLAYGLLIAGLCTH